MGRIRARLLSASGALAVLGLVLLLARGPINAQEKKEEKKVDARVTKERPRTVVVPPPAPVPPPPVKFEAHLPQRSAFFTSPQRKRFNFKIDPKTPVKDLLPVPPASRPTTMPVLEDDLTRVPEVFFQEPYARGLPPQKALEQTAHTIAKINHVNQKKTDAFMAVLLAGRTDLSGLPFAMGESCRMKQERSKHFKQALNTIRQARSGQVFVPPPAPSFVAPPPLRAARSAPSVPVAEPVRTVVGGGSAAAPVPIPTIAAPRAPSVPIKAPSFISADEPGSRVSAAQFWQRYREVCLREDNANAKYEPPYQEHVSRARIAALMQILAPESASTREGLVAFLATISHPEATRALAKLAIFSKERSVREAACDALKIRRERDYTDILIKALRYPWSAIAKNASEAIVKLERKDLIPQLVALLEEPDPRLPTVRKVGGKPVPVVRELVRVNHHRNCLMCHAPVGNSTGSTIVGFAETLEKTPDGKEIRRVVRREEAGGSLPADVPTAQVPIPGEPLPTPSQGYDNSQPDTLVRLDVTYLRQDFSEMQSVADAHPWPEMQRFDFLVRTRMLTEDEAQTYREKLTTREPGRLTPYQRAALAALRDLTGRDTEPTAQAWRRLLDLPQ